MENVLNSNIDFELNTAVINIKPIWAASAKNAFLALAAQIRMQVLNIFVSPSSDLGLMKRTILKLKSVLVTWPD